MRGNGYIGKCISTFLILTFLLKAGGVLVLHDWLHAQSNVSRSTDIPGVGQKGITCTCIDDFYVPFTETPEQVVQIPDPIRIEFVASLTSSIPSFSKFFHSLRGPPLKA